MEPITKKKAGRELGNAAAAAALCVGPDGKPISWETYQWYVRTGKPAGNPAPAHVEVDNETGQRMYPLEEVRKFQSQRPGRGNWGGIGARARIGSHVSAGHDAPCASCGRFERVRADGMVRAHWVGRGPNAAKCAGGGNPPVAASDNIVVETAAATAVTTGRIEQTPVRGPGQ